MMLLRFSTIDYPEILLPIVLVPPKRGEGCACRGECNSKATHAGPGSKLPDEPALEKN